MPTVYTPILRISNGRVRKSPTLPARASKTEALLALEEAVAICVELGWTVEYQGVSVTDGGGTYVDQRETDMLLEAGLN